MNNLITTDAPNLLAPIKEKKEIFYQGAENAIPVYMNCGASVGQFFVGNANKQNGNGQKQITFSFAKVNIFQGALFKTLDLSTKWALGLIILDTGNKNGYKYIYADMLFKSVTLYRSFKQLIEASVMTGTPVESFLITATMVKGKSGMYQFAEFSFEKMSDERLVICNDFLQANWKELQSTRIAREFAIKNITCRPLVEAFNEEIKGESEKKKAALEKKLESDIEANTSDLDFEEFSKDIGVALNYMEMSQGKAIEL